MANRTEQYLIPSLFEELQHERLAIFSTLDAETGAPVMNAISWLFAPDEKTIRLAVDGRSKMIDNVMKNPLVSIAIFAAESTYMISGYASVTEDRLADVPLKAAMIEVSISEVRDIMFYGSKMAALPVYEKTYDLRAAEKLDRQVMNALKKRM
ncbi:pyridoxamine 5'-phosphate oxidase family protein [Domibacillus epiphyticus]|uniref:Pyridoxamine 5'-phosphate oxidase N-terminal domain-containing protein n=1 Tax=Domibacillus epiphyticus TaxID=1714355 RepID=A0A1V2ABZ7_9BACI|nr:pyridoxamine 5'-phosphate oxidase family protein [Domibacillus epiphyticus]OMP68487.1 hypothetical protein BTO28_00090 [Domibacillus epiphyticus]